MWGVMPTEHFPSYKMDDVTNIAFTYIEGSPGQATPEIISVTGKSFDVNKKNFHFHIFLQYL